MKKKILLVLTVFFIISNLYSMEEPFIFEGIRPLGMGKAFIALADDENAISYNPAGLVHLEDSVISTVMEYYSASIDAEPARNYLRTGNYILFAMKYFGVTFKYNEESVSMLSNEAKKTERDIQLKLAGALEVSDDFSVGILSTLIYKTKPFVDSGYSEGAYDDSGYRVDFDLGAQYSIIKNLRIGMLIKLTSGGGGKRIIYDDDYKIAGSVAFPNFNMGLCWIIDDIIKIGFDVNNIFEPKNMESPSNCCENCLSLRRQYRLGIESDFSKDFIIRGGLRIGKAPIVTSELYYIWCPNIEYKDEISISLGLSYVWNKFIIECVLERIAGEGDNSINAGITYKF
ncbi:MAG: hypothetical protein ACLFP1_04170 [Candidatus Goldiibacteriota bacterium]